VKTITNEERTYCYGIDYYNGEIVTVNIGKRSGKIAAVKDTIKLTGHSIDPIKQSESHPTDILFTPLEEKVVVLDLGGDEVILYDETKINEEGHIRLVKDEEHSFKLKEGSGPKKMVFSPDGRYAYLINEISSMINVYTYEHGIFTQVQELLSYSPEEFSGDNTPTDIVISSNNKYLFVTNKGDDTVVVFAIDQENGTIKRVDCIETDEGPRCMWLFRDKWLVVAARTGGSLETFEIKEDERKGIIYETHQQYTLHGPVCMQAGNANLKVLL
jgi:6-phosphogluconolactonase (cycloisomerase 2 family)